MAKEEYTIKETADEDKECKTCGHMQEVEQSLAKQDGQHFTIAMKFCMCSRNPTNMAFGAEGLPDHWTPRK